MSEEVKIKDDTPLAQPGEATSSSSPKGFRHGDYKSAWDYWYQNTLPRYAQKEGKPNDFRKLEPGEEGGQLYHLWYTPLWQLGDFGLGLGLFFQLLIVLLLLLSVVGIINAWTIHYFASDAYGGDQSDLKLTLQGSASCDRSEYVCLNADCAVISDKLRRPCELSKAQGYLDLVGVLMIIGILMLVGKAQDLSAEEMDESEQTAQDYAVIVQDPDHDAKDPEEWRAFFSRFGHVTYVTVALDNGDLLEALALRRTCLYNVHVNSKNEGEEKSALNITDKLTREEPLPHWKALAQKLGFMRDLVWWHEKLVVVQASVAELTKRQYSAVKVFVTFELEESQRKCLQAMTTGLIPAMMEHAGAIHDDLKFRGTNVLHITEAYEPSQVRWRNLQYGLFPRMIEQAKMTAVATGVVLAAGLLVWGFSEAQAGWAAIVISVNNSILPVLMKMINVHEHHHSDSAQQSSLMFKLVAAQWMNTAFIIYITKPQEDILDYTYVKQVSAILWADAFTNPILLVLDIGGRVNRFFFAKRATTQLKMNSYFQGTSWFLAERYAAMVKTVFVCLFFSTIFPLGYFISSVAMLVAYWTCKYCLFRIWKSPSQLDDSLTKLTRFYIALAVLIKIIVTLHFYGGWPFDNLCVTDERITSVSSTAESYGITTDDYVYENCVQAPSRVWFISAKSWMTDDQKHLVRLYKVFALVSTFAFAILYFGGSAAFSVYHLFKGVYKPVGDDQGIPYSQVHQIQTYVPQVEVPQLPHPLLATSLTTLHTEHIAWTGDYLAYCLCSENDLPDLTEEERLKLFSPCVMFKADHTAVHDGPAAEGPHPMAVGDVTLTIN